MKFPIQIFEEKPFQWGLRGDPYLWEVLRLKFEPQDFFPSPEAFNQTLDKIFQDFLSKNGKVKAKNRIWISSFNQEGMSGGSIALDWWRETGLPLLKARYLVADIYE
jgi:hypothetical protein